VSDTPISISPDVAGAQPPPRKRVLLKWSLLATGLLLAYGLWQCGSGLVKGGQASDAAVAEFHHNLNAGSFEEIYSRSDQVFQESGKKEELFKFFTAIHKKLGNAGNASRGGINVNANTSGTFITVTYTTTYDKGAATETFTWRKGVAGDLKLVGYNIQSDALIVE
jgi:uncharacterized protein DUF3887